MWVSIEKKAALGDHEFNLKLCHLNVAQLKKDYHNCDSNKEIRWDVYQTFDIILGLITKGESSSKLLFSTINLKL